MTTEDKTYLKNNIVEYSKKSNKKVYIKTRDKNVGEEVLNIIGNNKNVFGDYEKVKEGFSYKDFTLKFDKKDQATKFYDKIKEIMTTTTVESPDPSPGDSGGGSDTGGSGSSNALFIIAGIIVLAAIGFYVWKKGK